MLFVLVDHTEQPRSTSIPMKDAALVYGWNWDDNLDLRRAESIGLRPVYDDGSRPNCRMWEKLVEDIPIYQDGIYYRQQKTVRRNYDDPNDMVVFGQLEDHGHKLITIMQNKQAKHNPSSVKYKQYQQAIDQVNQAIERIQQHVESKGTLHRLTLNFPKIEQELL